MSSYPEPLSGLSRLLNLGLPLVIRSLQSTPTDQPDWWSDKLNGKWVLAAFDHQKPDMLLGSGLSFEEALVDLDEGLAKGNRSLPEALTDSRNTGK